MKIFDLHCDTILACEVEKKELAHNDLHIDLEKMRAGEAYAQCFAIFLDKKVCDERKTTPYERYQEVYEYFEKQLNKNHDLLRAAHSVSEIQENASQNKISAILTVEGGEVLDGDLSRIEKLYADGVRLLTLTWNYENCIGFPHMTGGGLKRFGFECVERMNDLGMLIDVSHLSDEGFQDVLATSKKPVIASHSCARSICNHSRNLTDEMLKQIGINNGVVGLNFYSRFLGDTDAKSTFERLLYHARHIVNHAGIEALALGSDFDGIDGTLEWQDYSGMQTVVEYFRKSFSESELEKICYKNAERIFDCQ